MHKYTIYLWGDGRTNDVDEVIAFVSITLPMHWGPNSITPLQGCPIISQLQNQQRNQGIMGYTFRLKDDYHYELLNTCTQHNWHKLQN
jgi:hypothetical protein